MAGRRSPSFPPAGPPPSDHYWIDPRRFADSLTFRLEFAVNIHGKHGSSRFDGRRGAVAVGPAYGPQRDSARLRSRSAVAAGESPAQPLQRVCGRRRVDGPAAKQHRDGLDHQLLYRGRIGRSGSGARDHARRQCRHHADRSGAVVQHFSRCAGPVHHRTGRIPQRRAFPDQGHRTGRDRSRSDAAGAAYSARTRWHPRRRRLACAS